MSHLPAELRTALRGLLARPLFTAIVVLTLAFGIGANTAIYSLFHQMLLQPLPVPQPDQLVNLSSPGPKQGWSSSNNAGRNESIFSYPLFRDIERQQGDALTIAAHREIQVNLSFRGQTTHGSGALVSGSYFPVLQLQPALGRLLGARDDRTPGDTDAVVLSHAYWRNTLGADPSVIGQSLLVNGVALTIAGVAPESFDGTTVGSHPFVFVPITLRWSDNPRTLPDHVSRQSHWVYLFARLSPGVTAEQAQRLIDAPFKAVLNDVEAPQQDMSNATLQQFRARALLLTPGQRGQSSAPGEASASLSLLLAVALLVLLIACVNIANLQLARGAARMSELAVRAAIGASRRRLLQQMLVESSLLAVVGALLAIPVAAVALRALTLMMPASDSARIALQPAAIAYALLAALATVLVFGLLPALQLARTSPMGVIKGQSGQPGGGRAIARFRHALVAIQIAFSMTLLVLAGLFAQSLSNLGRVDLGLRPESLLSFSVSPSLNGQTPAQSRQTFDRIEQSVAALPGVSSVASSMVRLLSNSEVGNNVAVQGYEAAADEDTDVMRNDVGPGFFPTVGIPLIAGREFSAADAAGGARVAVVNRRFAERFALGNDVVGKRVSIGSGGPLDIQIVGLVGDAAYSGVRGEVPPMLFLPDRQNRELGEMTFYVRSQLAPEQQTGAIRAAIAGIDPDLPVEDLMTVVQQVRENTFEDRIVGLLSAVFAALATLLAASGLYGVLSYSIAQRQRELGLRLALGAPPARVRGMVLRQTGMLAVIGGGVGMAAALALGRAAESLLFGLRGHDPQVLVVSALVLAGVIFVASYLPARRAARMDPMLALRHD
jgi:putative ABC transport system permease protein